MPYSPDDPLSHPRCAPRVVPSEALSDMFGQWEQWLTPKLIEYREIDALWRSDFWRHSGFGSNATNTGRFSFLDENGMIRIEVNRIYGFVVSYLGALFPDSMKVEVRGATRGPGKRDRAQVYINDLIDRRGFVERIIFTMQLALTTDGAGLKITVDHDEENPDEKVKIRAVPWWNIVPDRDATDWDDQRFVMHVTYIPLADAIVRFADRTIKGNYRPEPLTQTPGTSFSQPRDGMLPNALNAGFVRVVEVYNFRDDYYVGEADPLNGAPIEDWAPVLDEDGRPVKTRGRFETYLPDEAGGWSRCRQVFPFPLSDVYGRPVAPLYPLIFNSELGYPFRGIAPVRNVYHQFIEKILSRTFESNAVKRNSRQLLVEEGWIDQKGEEAYAEGKDGAFVKYKRPEGDNRDIRSVIAPVPVQQLSPDNARYDAKIDEDIALGGARATSAFGEPMQTSATQYLGIEEHQRTQMGLMELRRDIWLRKVIQAILIAQKAALEACGPSSYVEVDVLGETQQIVAEDLDAYFRLDIRSGPSSLAAAERKKREFLAIVPILTELLPGLRQGDPIARAVYEHMADLYEFPAELRAQVLLKALAEMPKPPPPPPDVKPSAPGPGGPQSMPSPEGMAEGVGGMRGAAPMPQPDQPAVTASGQAQNINGAGTPPAPT